MKYAAMRRELARAGRCGRRLRLRASPESGQLGLVASGVAIKLPVDSRGTFVISTAKSI
jgi:hypothetical protein